MVESFLLTQNFYFSYTYDLTLSLQKLQETSPEFLNLPLFERVNFSLIVLNSINLKKKPRVIKDTCGIII